MKLLKCIACGVVFGCYDEKTDSELHCFRCHRFEEDAICFPMTMNFFKDKDNKEVICPLCKVGGFYEKHHNLSRV